MNVKKFQPLPDSLIETDDGSKKSLLSTLDNTKYNLLLFGYPAFFSKEVLKKLKDDFPLLLETHFVTLGNVDCYEKYQIKEKAYILLQKDTDVILFGDDIEDVLSFFNDLKDKIWN